MAFETGVSLSPSDLLSRLETRLNTDGWTIIRNIGSPGSQLSVSDSSAAVGTQFNFIADNTAASAHIKMQPSTGDAGIGAAFYAHTGSPNTSGTIGSYVSMGHEPSLTDQGFSGTHVAYFFFTGSTSAGRYCHIVVEGTAGVYFHMMFGTVEKAGTFSGGAYASATSFDDTSSLHWMWEFTGPSPGVATNWFRNDDHFTSIGQTTDVGASRWFEDVAFAGNIGSSTQMFAPLYQGGLQTFNQRTPFCPIWMTVWNALSPGITTTAWKLCGHIPDVRFVSMDGREPGETIVIGADTWHIFPMHRKTTDGSSITSVAYTDTFSSGSAPNHDSNLMGLAFRQN